MFCERGPQQPGPDCLKSISCLWEREGERQRACLPAPGREHRNGGKRKRQDRVFQGSQLYTLLGYFCQRKKSVLHLHNVKMYLNLSLLDFSFKKILYASLMLMQRWQLSRTTGEHFWNTWSLTSGSEKHGLNLTHHSEKRSSTTLLNKYPQLGRFHLKKNAKIAFLLKRISWILENKCYSLNTVMLQAVEYVALPLLRILQSHTNPALQKQKDRLHLDHISILLT